jgi:hypothetical protein
MGKKNIHSKGEMKEQQERTTLQIRGNTQSANSQPGFTQVNNKDPLKGANE